MRNVVKFTTAYLIIATLFTGCGGGGSKPPVDNTPPPTLSSDASLSGLAISAGTFDQVFQSDQSSYSSSVDFLVAATTVTATAAHAGAATSVNGTAAESGAPSMTVDLVEGGNVIDVRVTAEDGLTTRNYQISVTRLAATALSQQAYIKASDPEAEDRFGWSVSLDGDTLAVGAPNNDAVYVFVRDGAGMWTQQAYLSAVGGETFDAFGTEVALHGDLLAVAATSEDSAATGIDGNRSDNSALQSGAVYVFARDGAGIWSEEAYIKASNTEAQDSFGRAIALHGDTLAVASTDDSGADGINGNQNDNSAVNAGAVYVFVRDIAGDWRQQAFVKASNSDATDRFGTSGVALSGDTLVAGATTEDGGIAGINGDDTDNSVASSGAAYVFTRDSQGEWSQQAYVKASDLATSSAFGSDVSIDGDVLAVGSYVNSSNHGGGAAYVFERDNSGNWTEKAVIPSPNPTATWLLGWKVSVSGNLLAISDPDERSGSVGIDGDGANTDAIESGAVYVFEKDAMGNWNQLAYLKQSNTDARDEFGYALSMSGDTIAVGARYEASDAAGANGDQLNNNAKNAGAVYVFQ